MGTASADDIETYSQGLCHAFALAIAERTGWPIRIVVDHGNPWWQDPADPDNAIPSVVHCLARAPNGELWDVRGSRSEAELRDEMEAWCSIEEYDEVDVDHPTEMAVYIGCWGIEEEIERPLVELTSRDMSDARLAVERVLGEPLRRFACEPAAPGPEM
jgi:hypothetical protein